ncbi:MAG: Phosphoesterase [Acidimicrobiales bacterium]|nr:Phosphoesterase [Acidimicrobiales bacterium]
MGRRHLAVALMVPAPWSVEIDGLRRACGDPLLSRIGPHITLVPPTNVTEADVPGVLADLRVAAAASRAMHLVIGPVTTFEPVTPIAFLAVRGDALELAVLDGLRRDLATGPLDRPRDRPFVPHVTISGEQPASRLAAITGALVGWEVPLSFGLVSLMEHVRQPRPMWQPLAEEVLGLPRPSDD